MKVTQRHYTKAESWKLFDHVAKHYDRLNRILSFGQDRKWRNAMSEFLPKKDHIYLCDVATGTGDVLNSLIESCPQIRNASGVDLSEDMLKLAKEKLKDSRLEKIHFEQASASDLPFEDNIFDCVTMAFGIRNMENIVKPLAEIYRVLKPEGRLILLEFSLPKKGTLLRLGAWIYLKMLMPIIAFLFSGHIRPYLYLSKTIAFFPETDRFKKIIHQTGLNTIGEHCFLGGVANIICAEKPQSPKGVLQN